MNKTAKIHEIASTMKSDAFIIQYKSSSGFLSPRDKEVIGIAVRDIENGIQQITELLKDEDTD